MANWRSARPAPSQLEEGREVFGIALGVAQSLDEADLDLWAGGVRCCLDASSQLARQQHLTVELVRLRDLHLVRRAGCAEDIQQALTRLEFGLGSIDIPQQPLYTSTRDLADHLTLSGGSRWLGRLRVVVFDPERTAAAKLQRLDAVLDRMQPGVDDLPIGSTPLVRAVRERLTRAGRPETAMAYLEYALRPPASSTRTDGNPSSVEHPLSDGPATVRVVPSDATGPSDVSPSA